MNSFFNNLHGNVTLFLYNFFALDTYFNFSFALHSSTYILYLCCRIEVDSGVKFAPTESSQFVPVRETPRYVPPPTVTAAPPAAHRPTPPAIEFVPTTATEPTKKKKKSATTQAGKFKESFYEEMNVNFCFLVICKLLHL